MYNIEIISSKEWIDKNKKELNEFDLSPINLEIDNFCYSIENKIKNTKNEYICIINNDYVLDENSFKKIIELKNTDLVMLYSKILKSNDYNFIDNNSFLIFPKKLYQNKYDNNFKNFSDFITKTLIYFDRKSGIDILKFNKNIDFSISVNKIKIKNKKIKKLNNSNKKQDIQKEEYISSSKPNKQKPDILFMCDVEGWAWWLKSQYLKKYLSDYYNIDIISLIRNKQKIDFKKYDLYFTYGYSYVGKIMRVPKKKRITGITAHRPLNILADKMNCSYWTHANSVLLFNELEKIHNNPFYVPNGVDTSKFYTKKPLNENNFVFGHVGKKSPRKGQSDYIEPAIKKAGVKYFYHYNNYRNRISHDKMVDVHQNYDVFIVASEEDGTPCPALEAAACGRPIISNKIGNMPELIENYKTGILLEKRDVDLYVDAIKWCNSNPEKVIEMGKNIQKKVIEEWDWKILYKNYLLFFDKILNIKRDFSIYDNPALYHIDGYLKKIGIDKF